MLFCSLINPLTTEDTFWHRQILAACYQLAQSVLKIGSALIERVGYGEVGGSSTLPDSAWRRLQLPVEKPWSMTDGMFVCFLAQTGVETLLSPCRDSILAIQAVFSPEEFSLVRGP